MLYLRSMTMGAPVHFRQRLLTLSWVFAICGLLSGCGNKEGSEEEEFVAQAAEAGLSEEESRALRRQTVLNDSLQPLFCNYILNPNLTDREKLKRTDDLLAAGMSTNFNCKSSYLQARNNTLQKLGNAVLPGNPFDASNTEKIKAYYPVTMLFKEDSVMIRALAERGFRVDARARDMLSVLEYWIRQGDRPWVEFLLNFEIDYRQVRLFTTEEAMIDFLLEKGALEKQINPRMVLEDDRRENLLEKYAIDLTQIDCFDVELLLRSDGHAGVDLDRAKMLIRYDLDRNCLVNRRIMNAILDKRFPRDIKNGQKEAYQEAWLSFYASHEIDWHFCDEVDKTPLMKAIEDADLELVKLLVKYGADPKETCTRFQEPYDAVAFARQELKTLEGLNDAAWGERRQQLQEIIRFLEG